MKESVIQHHDRLRRFLRVLALRLQILFALEFLLLFLAAFSLALLGSFFPLALGEAFWYVGFFYSLGALGILAFLFIQGFRKALRRPAPERVAKELEARFPQLRDDVTNSLLLFPQLQAGGGPGPMSPALIAAQIRKTAERISSLRPAEVVRLKRAGRHLRLLAPILLAFPAVVILDPPFLTRSLALVTNPLSALPARETLISLEPGGAVILRGTSLEIRARVAGAVPEKLGLTVWPEAGPKVRAAMSPQDGGSFAYRVASAQVSFRYQADDGRAFSPVYALRVVDPPEVRNVRLTLIPPEYSRLPRETQEGGHVVALKATLVNLEGELTKEVAGGEVILNQESALALEIEGENFRGNWLVLHPGNYSIRVKDEFGFENPDPVRYPIRIKPDQPPEAEILLPAQDLEITGDEEIPVIYRARDDFGISGVKLLYRRGEREYSLSLKSPSGERILPPQTFKWEIADLSLTPGEKVIYRLGVWDNDTVSGPKVAYSRPLSLSVRDEGSLAAREGEEAQRIADALLGLLADHLEETRSRRELAGRMEELLGRLERNLEKMGEEGDRSGFETLRRNLASLRDRMPGAERETVTREMERLALLAEEIAKQARLKELEALARELRNRQKRLMDSLKDWKGPLKKEALDEALKELKRLSEVLRSIMEALAKMAPQLPEEFMNSPDLGGLDFQDLFQDLEEIQKKLLAGDLEGAREAAQRLFQALSEMMAALGRAGSQAARSQMDRTQGEMTRQAGELDRILAEQREILRETEAMDRELRARREEEAEKRLKERRPLLEEYLESLRRSLPPGAREGLEGGERMLRGGRAGRLEDQVKEWRKEFRGNPEAEKLLEEIERILEGLRPEPQEMMEGAQREKFPSLSSRQGNLQERTRELKEKLEMLAQLFPGLDSEILKSLGEAADSMGEASGKLRSEDPGGAIPPEQEALRRLGQSQQAMRQMSQQMAMRGQFNRWGRPWGYDPRPGWYYGPWGPLPTLPQPEVKRPIERGFTGIDREEFDPPSKEAYRAPKAFREKVMEALKDNAPSPYRREVEEYFRGLSE